MRKNKKLNLSNILLNIAIGLNLTILLLITAGYGQLASSLFTNTIQTVLIVSIAVSLNIFIKKVILRYYRSIVKEIHKSAIYTYWFMAAINTVISITTMFGLLLVWGIPIEHFLDWWHILVIKGIKVGKTSFSLTYLLKGIVTYLVIYYLFKWLAKILEKKILNRTELDLGTQHAIVTFTGYIGLGLAIITSVYSLGISSTSIAFILSAITFGLSFGLKEIFSNIVSGLILLIERPIKVGDYIQFEDEFGCVKKIQLRATVVESTRKQILLVPNSQLITSVVRNETYNPITRIDILIECAYEEDTVVVSKLLTSLVKKQPLVLKNPSPKVLLNNFNTFGVEFKVSTYCKQVNRKKVSNGIRQQILQCFQENNIEIPYPKQEIYIHKQKKRPDDSK